jgi:hypothetical protein
VTTEMYVAGAGDRWLRRRCGMRLDGQATLTTRRASTSLASPPPPCRSNPRRLANPLTLQRRRLSAAALARSKPMGAPMRWPSGARHEHAAGPYEEPYGDGTLSSLEVPLLLHSNAAKHNSPQSRSLR